jgi:hypothetical protein
VGASGTVAADGGLQAGHGETFPFSVGCGCEE